MNETQFYSSHVKKLDKHGHLTRIENKLGSGTPDVSYSIGGCTGWMETKVIKEGRLWFEKFQLPWMSKRLRFCRPTDLWVLAVSEDRLVIHLWPAWRVVKAPRLGIRKWSTVLVSDLDEFYRCSKPWRWDEVARLITGSKT